MPCQKVKILTRTRNNEFRLHQHLNISRHFELNTKEVDHVGAPIIIFMREIYEMGSSLHDPTIYSAINLCWSYGVLVNANTPCRSLEQQIRPRCMLRLYYWGASLSIRAQHLKYILHVRRLCVLLLVENAGLLLSLFNLSLAGLCNVKVNLQCFCFEWEVSGWLFCSLCVFDHPSFLGVVHFLIYCKWYMIAASETGFHRLKWLFICTKHTQDGHRWIILTSVALFVQSEF